MIIEGTKLPFKLQYIKEYWLYYEVIPKSLQYCCSSDDVLLVCKAPVSHRNVDSPNTPQNEVQSHYYEIYKLKCR